MIKSIYKDYEVLYKSTILSLANYLKENKKIESLIIGISGGIDSAVTTVIARKAIELVSEVKLIGRSLPMNPTELDEIKRSVKVGSNFCDDFDVYNLEKAYINLIENIEIKKTSGTGELSFEDKVRSGNIRARIRMIQLYHLAHQFKGMVLSTDNLTEYYLGFWTLHGDVGDFGALQNLWKTEVYGIAWYIYNQYIIEHKKDIADAILSCIKAEPTDGLGITTSDLAQIEADSYFEVDSILIDYLNGDKEIINHPVIKRHNNTHFKRENPLNISRKVLIGT